MTLFLSIAGTLAFLALLSLVWRNRPFLALGIILGTTTVLAIGAVLRPSGLQHVPLWLPPLPFALVAIVLLFFGILAWRIGRSGS